MALTFPVALAEFFAGLPVKSAVPDLTEALYQSRTAGGEVLTADLGTRLWSAEVTIARRPHREAEAIKAVAHVLRQAGRSMFVRLPLSAAPARDLDGALLGAATPSIYALPTGNRTMRLQGLPPQYKLTAGDFLSFTYDIGDGLTRYALHQLVEDAQSFALDLSNTFEVVPNIRPGAVVGAAVQLINPFFKAVMVPGSFSPGTQDKLFTSGMTFRVIQTLR